MSRRWPRTPSSALRPLGAGIVAVAWLTACASESPRSAAARLTAATPRCRFGAPAATAAQTTLDELLANPEKYASARVRIRGFMLNEFENKALYRSEEESARPILEPRRARCDDAPGLRVPQVNAIWLDVGNLPTECSRREVTLEGRFNPCEEGHMSLFPGGLVDVSFASDVP
jgi:hypothetical protein